MAIALTIVTFILFALQDTVSKFLVADYSVFQILWVRYAVSFSLALLILSLSGDWAQLSSTRHPVQNILRAAILAVETLLAILSFRYLPLAMAETLILTFPFFVTLLSFSVLNEPVGPRRRLAVLAGFFGVLLVLRPGFDFQPAMLLGLSCGLMFGAYTLMTRRLTRTENPNAMLVWVTGIGFIFSSLLAPYNWKTPEPLDFGLMVLIGCIATLAHFLLIKALFMAQAIVVQPFTYSIVLAGIFFGYIFFDEIPAWTTLGGAAIIAAAGIYTFLRERKVSPEQDQKQAPST